MSGPAPSRDPAFASPGWPGGWYPGDPETCAREIARLQEAAGGGALRLDRARLVVGPHAGWHYAGSIMGRAFASVRVPHTIAVLAPNHTGRGEALALYPGGGAWRTPLGDIAVDEGLAARILRECPGVVADEEAHADEHAIEVLLPFLRAGQTDLRMAAIVVAEGDVDRLVEVGRGLARALRATGACGGDDDGGPLIVASSDFTHCGPRYRQVPPRGESARAFARRQDEAAIPAICALDAPGLMRVVRAKNVTMCGRHPVVAAIAAARELGATAGRLLAYACSADVSGEEDDAPNVVGYAAIVAS